MQKHKKGIFRRFKTLFIYSVIFYTNFIYLLVYAPENGQKTLYNANCINLFLNIRAFLGDCERESTHGRPMASSEPMASESVRKPSQKWWCFLNQKTSKKYGVFYQQNTFWNWHILITVFYCNFTYFERKQIVNCCNVNFL